MTDQGSRDTAGGEQLVGVVGVWPSQLVTSWTSLRGGGPAVVEQLYSSPIAATRLVLNQGD